MRDTCNLYVTRTDCTAVNHTGPDGVYAHKGDLVVLKPSRVSESGAAAAPDQPLVVVAYSHSHLPHSCESFTGRAAPRGRLH
ncbi:hypothetical protein J6590_036402 [Homalodisca vitripennis]|nr:hypothetical protein J6590_036402 [Homalodisca vitripennis]